MILDLYAGAGGWCEGVRLAHGRHRQLAAGVKASASPMVGIDNWLDACRTATAAGHLRLCTDVATYPTAPFVGQVYGMVGAPPCQPWSAAGARLGELDRVRVYALVDLFATGDPEAERAWAWASWADPRSHHAAQPVRWIRDLRPDWVCLEQVKEVLPLWQHIGRILRGWGYAVWVGKLNAADYGVPQTRIRAFLAASLTRRPSAPTPTHYDPRRGVAMVGAPWVSMGEALGVDGVVRTGTNTMVTRAGDQEPYERDTSRPSPVVMAHTGRWKLVSAHRQKTNDRTQPRGLDQPAHTVAFGHSDMRWVLRNGSQDNACERDLNEPAGTLFFGERHNDVSWVATRPATTVAGDPRIAAPGHRDRAGGERQHTDSIKVTVAEAAVLQGFRPDYPWRGTETAQYTQVGNAVPPPLAAVVLGQVT